MRSWTQSLFGWNLAFHRLRLLIFDEKQLLLKKNLQLFLLQRDLNVGELILAPGFKN